MNGWLYGDVNTMGAGYPENSRFFFKYFNTTMNDVKVPHKTPLFVDSYWVDSWLSQNSNTFPHGFQAE
jgi:hypothetical protein